LLVKTIKKPVAVLLEEKNLKKLDYELTLM